MIPELPIDFADLAAQGASVMGVVIAGVVGIFCLVSLINMGIKWLRRAFIGSRSHYDSDPYAGTGMGCYDWYEIDDVAYVCMEDNRYWYVLPDGSWHRMDDPE